MAKRVSLDQRRTMFDFMRGHEDFARGRVCGPDAARAKKRLSEELAALLNSIGSGCTKTPEKWLKSWQDWKSDVKAKALKINKARSGTGGGPCPLPLSPLEADLVQFFGVEMVEGLPGVADPLQVAVDLATPMEEYEEEEPSIPQTPQQSRSRPDPLHSILLRQAAAIEELSSGMNNIAGALLKIAAALQPEILLPLEEG